MTPRYLHTLMGWILILLIVGCDGVIGSDKKWDHCGICGGDNSTCRIVSGLYTMPQLPYGYNLIATIPKGACNINITEMQPSLNYLALRYLNGSYILNGNWAINWSGSFEAAGTAFEYTRDEASTGIEKLLARGPTTGPVDMMILSQQSNLGIKYEYTLPLRDTTSGWPTLVHSPHQLTPSVASYPHHRIRGGRNERNRTHHGRHRDHRKRGQENDKEHHSNVIDDSPVLDEVAADQKKFNEARTVLDQPAIVDDQMGPFEWKVSDMTDCTRTCGGGTQKSIVSCVKESSLAVVAEHNCDTSLKPEVQTNRCNTRPCPPEWILSEWGKCNVSCGEGMQKRELLCKQTVSTTLLITVSDAMCTQERPEVLQKCSAGPCSYQWQANEWKECSVQCGIGTRGRDVSCVDAKKTKSSDVSCDANKRPHSEETCNAGSCNSAGTWFFTDWSTQCFAECGQGTQLRKVYCLDSKGVSNENCHQSSKPSSTRPCNSNKSCMGKWFSGPWKTCSSNCGPGLQTRDVVCMSLYRGHYKIAVDSMCAGVEKPSKEQQCNLGACRPEWYTNEWSQCSKSCDTGLQIREIKCMDEYQRWSKDCDEVKMPAMYRSCAIAKCSTDGQSQGDSGCVDKYNHCRLVVQSRLCSYSYYRNVCCYSCYKYR